MENEARVNVMCVEDEDQEFCEVGAYVRGKVEDHVISSGDAPSDSKSIIAQVAEAAQSAAKKRRLHKIAEQDLAKKKDKRKKLLEAADKLAYEIAWLEKSPEERKVYKRNLDTHCKLLAGAIALKMYENENQIFDRNAFKNAVLAGLKNFEEKAYFKKIFHE